MGKTRSRRSQILAEKREDVARMVHATVSYAAFGMAVMLATADEMEAFYAA